MVKRLEQAKLRLLRAKILATNSSEGRSRAKDRLVVMVRGPYWLHVYWELTPAGIVRAQAALGELWHTAKPILRLLTVSSPGASTASERVARDIPIHGGVTNWYVDVLNPPQTYRMEIGYLATGGRFFSLARSNTVITPSSPADEKLDNHWSEVVEDCDKIYAMSGGYSPEVNSSELQEVLEERLRRPVGSSIGNRYGTGAEYLVMRDRAVQFKVDAEMVIHGATHPEAQVTLQGAPLKLRPTALSASVSNYLIAARSFPWSPARRTVPHNVQSCSRSSVTRRSWNRSTANRTIDSRLALAAAFCLLLAAFCPLPVAC